MKIVQLEARRETETRRTHDADNLIVAKDKDKDKDIQEEIDALEVVGVFDLEEQDRVALEEMMNGY
jgi:hypothetical protein